MYFILPNGIKRQDGLVIPADDGNTDYQEYLAWCANGNKASVETKPFANQKAEKLAQIDAQISACECPTDRALRELVQPSSNSYARMQRIESEVAPMRTKRAAIVAASTQSALDAITI